MQAELGNDRQVVGAAHDDARQVVSKGLISDAPFLYTPPQIALAGLYHANKEMTLEYLEKKFQTAPDTIAFLESILKHCLDELQSLEIPSSEEGKDIDRKLHMCMDPEKQLQRAKQKRAAGTSDGGTSKRFKTEDGDILSVQATPSPSLPPEGFTSS
jgi:cyclin H